MSDQITVAGFFGRIGNIFRRGSRDALPVRAALPGLLEQVVTSESTPETATETDESDEVVEATLEPRTTFLRPWAKRDQAIDSLQNGISTLSGLMDTIRDTLEKNSDRQGELLNYLSHLPEALQTLPEGNRVQGEALKAIQIGIEQQSAQQSKLANVLDRIDRDGNESIHVQGEALRMINAGIEQQNTQQNKLANVLERMDRDSNDGIRMQGEALNAIHISIEQQNTQQNKLADVLERMDRDSSDSIRMQGEALKVIQIGIEQQNTQQNKLASVLDRMDRDSNENLRMQGEALKAIQIGIEQQNTHQDKLASVLERIDRGSNEGLRVQGEALKAIQVGIQQQNTQQNKLANVLERMHLDNGQSIRTLDIVRDRIETITQHEEAISQSLQSVGAALKSVSATSEASAQVLENLQSNISSRDNQLEKVIRRQNVRFTTMLTVAIVMSMAALTAVVVFGYLGYEVLSKMGK